MNRTSGLRSWRTRIILQHLIAPLHECRVDMDVGRRVGDTAVSWLHLESNSLARCAIFARSPATIARNSVGVLVRTVKALLDKRAAIAGSEPTARISVLMR